MTEEQKRKAKIHIIGNSVSGLGDGVYRFLEDGEHIRFTKCTLTARNAEFEINDRPERRIWFSQLDRFYINDSISKCLMPSIEFKERGVVAIFSFTPQEFYEAVKGKLFEVSICRDALGAIDTKSEMSKRILGDKDIKTFKDLSEHLDECIKYAKNCIENDEIDELGDLIKKSAAYDLKEV